MGFFTKIQGSISKAWNDLKQGISDIYDGSDILTRHLEDRALIARQPITKDFYTPSKEPVSSIEKFNVFMFSGIDYRGQEQHGFDKRGYGGGVDAEIDFAKAFVPPPANLFLTAKASMGASGSVSRHRLIFISHQGDLSDYRNAIRLDRSVQNNPLALCEMVGSHKKANLRGEIEVGGKIDSTDFIPLKIGEVESFAMGIKATASGSASCEGTWVVVSDPSPQFVAREISKVQSWLDQTLKGSASTKKVLKDALRGEVNPHCYLTWFYGAKDAGADLSAGAYVATAAKAGQVSGDTLGPSGTLKATAQGPSIKWTTKRSTYRLNLPTQISSLILTQDAEVLYKQVGGEIYGFAMDFELGPATIDEDKNGAITPVDDPLSYFLKPDVNIEEQAAKVDTGSTVGNSLLTMAGKGADKLGSIAYEKVTDKVYKKLEKKLYSGERIEAKISAKSLKISLSKEETEKLSKKWGDAINSMSYRAASAYWNTKDSITALPLKNPTLSLGSGMIYGQSLTLPSLVKMWVNEEECEKIFGSGVGLPSAKAIQEKTKQLLSLNIADNEGLHYPSAIPSLTQWLESTDTGEWRRKISPVDDLVKGFWKHMGTPALWADPYNKILAKAKLATTPSSDEMHQAKAILSAAILELTQRGTFYTNILIKINEWIDHRGGLNPAKANGRWPGVQKLGVACEEYALQTDYLLTQLDVLYEACESLQLKESLQKSLKVSRQDLDTLLSDKGFVDLVQGICDTPSQAPGAFIIEAYFKLDSDSLSKGAKFKDLPKGTKNTQRDIQDGLADLFESRNLILERLSVRYRLGDSKNASRSFKLGVRKIGPAGVKFSLDRILEAGSEGNMVLHQKWFNDASNNNAANHPYKDTLPSLTLMS